MLALCIIVLAPEFPHTLRLHGSAVVVDEVGGPNVVPITSKRGVLENNSSKYNVRDLPTGNQALSGPCCPYFPAIDVITFPLYPSALSSSTTI